MRMRSDARDDRKTRMSSLSFCMTQAAGDPDELKLRLSDEKSLAWRDVRTGRRFSQYETVRSAQ